MEGTIEMDEPDTNVILDVTIVVRNCAPDSGSVEPCDPEDSTYYYSQFLLNFACV